MEEKKVSEQIKKANELLSNIKQRQELINNSINNSKIQLEKIDSDILNSKKKLKELQDKEESFNKLILDKKSTIELNNAEIKSLNENILSINKEIKEKEVSFIKKSIENDKLLKENKELQDNLKNTTNKINNEAKLLVDELRTKITELQNTEISLINKIRVLKQSINLLDESKTSLNADIKELNDKKEEFLCNISDLDGKIVEKNDIIELKNAEISQYNNNIEKLNEVKLNIKSDNDKTLLELEKNKNELAKIMKTMGALANKKAYLDTMEEQIKQSYERLGLEYQSYA